MEKKEIIIILFSIVAIIIIALFLFNNSSSNLTYHSICKDMNCFIASSANCSSTNYTLTRSIISDVGWNLTGSSLFSMSSVGKNNCSLYQVVLNESVSLTPAEIQKYLSLGDNQSQIQDSINSLNEYLKGMAKPNGTCFFSNSSHLATYLKRIGDGTFSGNWTCTIDINSNTTTCKRFGDWTLADSCTPTFVGVFPQSEVNWQAH